MRFYNTKHVWLCLPIISRCSFTDCRGQTEMDNAQWQRWTQCV